MHHAEDRSNVLRLYEELGVRPQDGLARLSERYRARLRELHPDAANATTEADVGWLTRSYRDAVAFHHVHGRLPGGDAVHRAGDAAPRALVVARRAPREARHWRWMLPIAIAAAVMSVVWVLVE